MNCTEYLPVVREILYRAGEMLMLFRKSAKLSVVNKSHSVFDIQTSADVAIENYICEALRAEFPHLDVSGEESGGQSPESIHWIIDPIDGTYSFVDGDSDVSIVVGLTDPRNDEMLFSAVYDPFTLDFYYAVKGFGAFVNDRPLLVFRGQRDFGPRVIVDCVFNDKISKLLLELRDEGLITAYSGTGSLALRLCKVARGSRDACFSHAANGALIAIHDFGPAGLIVREAGGKITDLRGELISLTRPAVNIWALGGQIGGNIAELVKQRLIRGNYQDI